MHSLQRSRLAAYKSARARNIALHGEKLVDRLDDFYGTVASLFSNGLIAGVKIGVIPRTS